MSNSDLSRDIERALAALAIDHGLISPTDAVQLIAEARNSARPLVQMILEQIREGDLLKAIAAELPPLRYVDLLDGKNRLALEESVLARCDANYLAAASILPMVNEDGKVVGVLANPADPDAVKYLRSQFPEGIAHVCLASRQQIQAMLLSVVNEFEHTDHDDDNVVLRWADFILNKAVADRASDIVFRLNVDGTMFLRMRVDGGWRRVTFPLLGKELEAIAAILTKCSTIDSFDLKQAQDGTFSFKVGNRSVDARVGLLPQANGPNVTIRILDPESLRKRPEDMGFNPRHLISMRSTLELPQGLAIVVGPTGSGKSTTLYSLLREVDAVTKNVITVEDPVEYRLPFIGQTQIRSDLGERSLTFAKALRQILRSAPDVILVGEIRDAETARVAMDASITGHLVLSTLHAPDAIGAYMRLAEMGIPPYLIAEAISLVVSQRLVRRVHGCATYGPPNEVERDILAGWGVTDIDTVAHHEGCSACNSSGYLGRLAVAEVLEPSQELRTDIARRADTADLRRTARATTAWRPILHDGIRHIRDGRTTVFEVARSLLVDADNEAEPIAGDTI